MEITHKWLLLDTDHRDWGSHHRELEDSARKVMNKSPSPRHEIHVDRITAEMAEKERVGLTFNRSNQDALADRWGELEVLNVAFLQDVIAMEDQIKDDLAKAEKQVESFVISRAQILTMRSRIEQMAGLAIHIDFYKRMLERRIQSLEGTNAFLMRCAEQMGFDHPRQIIDRYEALTAVFHEIFYEFENRANVLNNLKDECTSIVDQTVKENMLKFNAMSNMYSHHKDLQLEISEMTRFIQSKLDAGSMSEKNAFKMREAILQIYQRMMDYRDLPADESNTLAQLAAIEYRMKTLTSVINQVHEAIMIDTMTPKVKKKVAKTKSWSTNDSEKTVAKTESTNITKEAEQAVKRMKELTEEERRASFMDDDDDFDDDSGSSVGKFDDEDLSQDERQPNEPSKGSSSQRQSISETMDKSSNVKSLDSNRSDLHTKTSLRQSSDVRSFTENVNYNKYTSSCMINATKKTKCKAKRYSENNRVVMKTGQSVSKTKTQTGTQNKSLVKLSSPPRSRKQQVRNNGKDKTATKPKAAVARSKAIDYPIETSLEGSVLVSSARLCRAKKADHSPVPYRYGDSALLDAANENMSSLNVKPNRAKTSRLPTKEYIKTGDTIHLQQKGVKVCARSSSKKSPGRGVWEEYPRCDSLVVKEEKPATTAREDDRLKPGHQTSTLEKKSKPVDNKTVDQRRASRKTDDKHRLAMSSQSRHSHNNSTTDNSQSRTDLKPTMSRAGACQNVFRSKRRHLPMAKDKAISGTSLEFQTPLLPNINIYSTNGRLERDESCAVGWTKRLPGAIPRQRVRNQLTSGYTRKRLGEHAETRRRLKENGLQILYDVHLRSRKTQGTSVVTQDPK